MIGVARDTKLYGVDPEGIDSPTPVAFVPYAYQQTLTMGLTIRVAGDPAAITSNVRAALRAADPNLPLYQARTMDDQRRLNYWQYGLYGWIFGTIGVVGMLLAGIGLYGVLSYSVAQRTQEIGVRVAMGAGRREVLRLIIGYGLLLAGIGVAVGLVLAPLSTYLAKSLLYNVSPFDPVTFASCRCSCWPSRCSRAGSRPSGPRASIRSRRSGASRSSQSATEDRKFEAAAILESRVGRIETWPMVSIRCSIARFIEESSSAITRAPIIDLR